MTDSLRDRLIAAVIAAEPAAQRFIDVDGQMSEEGRPCEGATYIDAPGIGFCHCTDGELLVMDTQGHRRRAGPTHVPTGPH